MSTTVIVGDSICGGREKNIFPASSNEVFLRGFNTVAGYNPDGSSIVFEGGGEIIAAVSGAVEITDKVVSVKGRFSRYVPEIGDVVVGRVVEIIGNKWTVDINCSQAAVMLLSNVSEPGGILRRRGRSDELTMRQLFDQGDIIAAEVQRISPDGVPFLQSRAGNKYGRITSVGRLVSVRASLIKSSKHHFISFPEYSTNLIIGTNGNIWVSQLTPADSPASDTTEVRQSVSRVANCIKAMNERGLPICPDSIKSSIDISLTTGISSSDLLSESGKDLIFAGTKRKYKRVRDTQ